MWIGLFIMLAMIGGLIGWAVWAYRSDRERQNSPDEPTS
jgi:hypothetical protein